MTFRRRAGWGHRAPGLTVAAVMSGRAKPSGPARPGGPRGPGGGPGAAVRRSPMLCSVVAGGPPRAPAVAAPFAGRPAGDRRRLSRSLRWSSSGPPARATPERSRIGPAMVAKSWSAGGGAVVGRRGPGNRGPGGGGPGGGGSGGGGQGGGRGPPERSRRSGPGGAGGQPRRSAIPGLANR